MSSSSSSSSSTTTTSKIPSTSSTSTNLNHHHHQSTFKALSRREEDEFQRQIKLKSLKSCDQWVSDFANCTSTRTFSIVWSCRTQWKNLQDCMRLQMDQDKLDRERLEYINHRQEYKVPYKKL